MLGLIITSNAIELSGNFFKYLEYWILFIYVSLLLLLMSLIDKKVFLFLKKKQLINLKEPKTFMLYYGISFINVALIYILGLTFFFEIIDFFYNLELTESSIEGQISFTLSIVSILLTSFIITTFFLFSKMNNNFNSKLNSNNNKQTEKMLATFKLFKELLKNEKIYKDENLSREIVAERLGVSNSYLSKIIKEYTHSNFTEIINSSRVEDVKKKLSDKTYDPYSLLNIGLEAGFKSKSTFFTIFKKHTGLTPKNYKETLK